MSYSGVSYVSHLSVCFTDGHFPDAVFAVSLMFIDPSAAILYSPSLFGMVAIIWPLEFLIVHMPLMKIMENPALLSLQVDMRVNVISGACVTYQFSLFLCSLI